MDGEEVIGHEEEKRPQTYATIIARCAQGHTQELKIDGNLGLEWAAHYMGLLDGSSEMYKFPPGPESIIGKCGICGTQIQCSLRGPSQTIAPSGVESAAKAGTPGE